MGFSHGGCDYLRADVDVDDSLPLGRVSADMFGRWVMLGAAMAVVATSVARLVVDIAGVLHHNVGNQLVLRFFLWRRDSGGAVFQQRVDERLCGVSRYHQAELGTVDGCLGLDVGGDCVAIVAAQATGLQLEAECYHHRGGCGRDCGAAFGAGYAATSPSG